MGSILLGGFARKRRGLPEIRLLNMLYEQSPENIEDQVAIIARPGLVDFGDLGAATRGFFCRDGVFDGDAFIVAGTALYRVTRAGVATNVGTIPGTGRVSMDGNASALGIATGSALYKYNGSAVSTVAVPDSSGGISSVVYILGYFLVSTTGRHKVFFSKVGLLEFDEDGLDYFSAEFWADPLEGLITQTDFVWMLGSRTIETWAPRSDPDRPFYRIEGRLIKIGSASLYATVDVDGAIFFVGRDRMVYRAAGSPEKISDHALDEALKGADFSNLRAFAFAVEGHTFYVLHTGSKTFAFDLSTQRWTRFSSYGKPYWRPHLGCMFDDGTWIVGDSDEGKLWTLSADVNKDGEDPMIRRVPGFLEIVNAPERCRNVAAWVTVGSVADPDADPMIGLDVSDDGGRTWDGIALEPLGRQGEFFETVMWTQLGLMTQPRRDFIFEVSDDVAVTFTRAKFNVSAV